MHSLLARASLAVSRDTSILALILLARVICGDYLAARLTWSQANK